MFSPAIIFAETIVLKSGQTIEGKIIEKTDKYIKIEFEGVPLIYFLDEIEGIKEDSIVTTQLNINSLPEDEPFEQVSEYVNKSHSIIRLMVTKIAEKDALLAQASMSENKEEMRIIRTEMREIVRQHKEEFLSLSMPQTCQALHTAFLNMFQLMEDIQNELINGDAEQANLLSKQVPEVLKKIAEEGNSLIQKYSKTISPAPK